MCGIIGIASKNKITDRAWLAMGRDAMHHRGPDDTGEWWATNGRVGLGHRRLTVIDLSPSGHQPMQDGTGELTIVFNGEIYNFIDLRNILEPKGYSFRSHSDTEVILAAYLEWGTDCLTHLNGMFAFALYDSRHERLFLARDRAGEKPLFYSMENGSVRFASEIKGILADKSLPRQIDWKGLDCYLAEGYVPGNRSIVQGVMKLPPAHALTFDLNSGKSRLWRYWQLPVYDSSLAVAAADENELLRELEDLLHDSVRRQLVADVPVGVLLSGGLDSSLVTAMAARSARTVKTFTIRFPGYGKYDETEHARLIAQHFATDHMELEAEPTTVELLPVLARQFDEPIIDSSMIPTFLVSRLVRQNCTVALGGDGGDELFGGYRHYSRLMWLYQYLGSVPLGIRRALANLIGPNLPIGFKGRNWLQALDTDFRDGLPLIASYYDKKSRNRLLTTRFKNDSVAEEIRETRISKTEDFMQRATRTDFNNYLPENILVKVDRSSMLNSLELRSPMLDVQLIEFAFGKVPSHLKVTANARKKLLRKLALRLLPPEFDQNRKQGFSIPLASWLQSGSWLNYFREVLLDSSQDLFDHRFIQSLFDGQRKGRSNGERLFGLVMLELWRREYQVEL